MKEKLQELINKWKAQIKTKDNFIEINAKFNQSVNERRRLDAEKYQLELCVKALERLIKNS